MARFLLLTNQLFEWAGSETVIIEIAEELEKRGHEVCVFANIFGDSFIEKLKYNSISFVRKRKNIKIADFDVVYCQHQVLSLFANQLIHAAKAGKLPKIIYGHLSPYVPLEFPGSNIESLFSSCGLCNSRETMQKMVELGLPEEKLKLFPNPAPEAFFSLDAPSDPPKSILAVSNHFPEEVINALKILEEKGFSVTRRGSEFKNERVSPRDIQDHDMVLTIGKTVQYAIASRRPVYIYDRFGGPGWLTAENFERASFYNFSGRCTSKIKSANTIADEIERIDYISLDLLSTSLSRDEFRLPFYIENFFLDKNCFIDSKKHLSFFEKIHILIELFRYNLKISKLKIKQPLRPVYYFLKRRI
ncbi:glycosyltransferase [Halovulum dunhuangense]|uniref:Glycosyltransferase n=1 Tax=Halovulum dunhuangense TaxID=1505036 RepID=A0A849L7F8_9RHOB|nr:glycosyltransferase [Halovulum dunhuangense]NNU81991.1 glycosyltransferase [Halovulum dunhuangense]